MLCANFEANSNDMQPLYSSSGRPISAKRRWGLEAAPFPILV